MAQGLKCPVKGDFCWWVGWLLRKPGGSGRQGARMAWMVAMAEKSLAMSRGVRGLVPRWAQNNTGEEGAPWTLRMTGPTAQALVHEYGSG